MAVWSLGFAELPAHGPYHSKIVQGSRHRAKDAAQNASDGCGGACGGPHGRAQQGGGGGAAQVYGSDQGKRRRVEALQGEVHDLGRALAAAAAEYRRVLGHNREVGIPPSNCR